MPKTFPRFEPNQVLTHEHLNALVDHFDQEIRRTRDRLVGIGIACGLELKSDLHSNLVVSRGNGITSDGDHVLFDADAAFTHRRLYDDPVGYFEERGLTGAIWELLPTPTEPMPDVSSIADHPGLLANKVAVIYVEALEEDLRNCRENDCNEKGRREVFTTRVLLVDPSDAARLAIPEEVDLSPPSSGAPHLVSIPRPRLLGLDPSSYEAVAKEFVEACLIGRDRLGPVLQEYFERLVPALGTVRARPVIATIDEALAATGNVGVQYVYDWMRELWQGYVELGLAASALRSRCCPDSALFPRHLLLGDVIDNAAPSYRPPRIPPAKSPRRFPFLPAQQLAGQKEARDRAALYLQRSVLQLESFAFQPGAQKLAIIPEGGPNAKLERRAIGSYYKQGQPSLRDHWSPELTRAGWQASIPWGTATALDGTYEWAPFFRVEGHLEMPVAQVLQELDELRALHSQPFDVVAVSLDANFSQAVIDRECRWADLDSAWLELRATWQCALEREIRFFYGHTAEGGKGRFTGKVTKPEGVTEMVHIKVLDTGALYPVEQDGTFELELGEGPWVVQAVAGNRAGDTFFVEIRPDETVAQELNVKDESITSRTQSIPYRAMLPQKAVGEYFAEWAGNFPILEAADRIDMIGVGDSIGGSQGEALVDIKLLTKLLAQLRAVSELIDRELDEVDFDEVASRSKAYVSTANELEKRLVAKGKALTPPRALLLQHVHLVKAICFVDAALVIRGAFNSRRSQLKERLTLQAFIEKHPGLEHLGGAPRGGTLVLAYENETVKADFALPYLSCDPCGDLLLKGGEPLQPPATITASIEPNDEYKEILVPEVADSEKGLQIRAVITDLEDLAKATIDGARIRIVPSEALFTRTSLDLEYLVEEVETSRLAIGLVKLSISDVKPLPTPAELTVEVFPGRSLDIVPPAAIPSDVRIVEVKILPEGIGDVSIREDGKAFTFYPTEKFDGGRAEYLLDAGRRGKATGVVHLVAGKEAQKIEIPDVHLEVQELSRPLRVDLPLPGTREDLAVTKLEGLDPDVGSLKLLADRGPLEYWPGPFRRPVEKVSELPVRYEVRSEKTSESGVGRVILRFRLKGLPVLVGGDRMDGPLRPVPIQEKRPLTHLPKAGGAVDADGKVLKTEVTKTKPATGSAAAAKAAAAKPTAKTATAKAARATAGVTKAAAPKKSGTAKAATKTTAARKTPKKSTTRKGGGGR